MAGRFIDKLTESQRARLEPAKKEIVATTAVKKW